MKWISTYTFVTASSFLEYVSSGEAWGETKMQLKILITERPEIPEQLKIDLKRDILPLMPLIT